jgi:hypothetical protein
MTTTEAAAILDVTANSVGRFKREGLIRARVVVEDGHARLELNGRDVQALDDLRKRYGVVEGMRRARAKRRVGR